MATIDQLHFDVDVSRTYKNKDGYTAGGYKLNWSFKTETHTPQTFLDTVIKQGWPYTMAHQKRHPKETGAAARKVSTPKHTENFISRQELTLDDDRAAAGVVAGWLADPFFSRYGWAFVESVNSRPGAEKGHPTFIFDRPITDPDLYKECLLAAIAYWPQIDPLKNIDRTIYNAEGARVHLVGNICPFDVFERDILQPYRAERDAALAHAEAEAEARRKAWAASDQSEPVNGQIARYVAAAVSGVVTTIANTREGGGSGETRHKSLYNGAARLESLALADWLDSDARAALAHAEAALLAAATTNGYTAKYGQSETERVIRDGRAIATPASQPDWKIYDQAATSDQQPPEPETPPETAVNVPAGGYLADILDPADLPDRCILDAQTGIGKTTWAATRLADDSFPIIAFSSTVALEQQMSRYPEFGAWYELVKNARPDLPGVFTTYESAPAVIKHLAGQGLDLGRVSFVVDECHNFSLAGYRNEALGGIVDLTEAHPFKRVILMSGTTLPMFGVFTDYEPVYIGSHQRGQVGQIVKWKRQTDDGDYEGGMLDTAASLACKHAINGGRVLLHLDDKGKKLHGLIARLEAGGIDQANIFTLNSDNKYEAVGRQIADYETVPDHCQALIVTSVFVESSNLTTPFDAGILCSRMHPAAAQQFANRQRGAVGMGVIYILHGGAGKGWAFDVDAALTHAEAGAAWLAADLNLKAENGVTDPARKLYGGEYGRLVKLVGDKWEVDPLGVTQHVHNSLMGYAANNAEALKRQLAQWGWAFNPDMQQVVTAADKTEDQLAAEAERRRELQQVATADYESILLWLAKLDQDQAERFTGGDLPLSAKQRRVLDRAVTLAGMLGDVGAWADSLGLLASIGDSGQAFNRLCRTVLADQFVSEGDAFTQQILGAFEPGETLTRSERHGRLTAVYELNAKMRPFVAKMKRYHWSDDETARLDEKSADDVIRMLYTIQPGQQRRDGKVKRIWTIGKARPLPGLLVEGRDKLRELLQRDAAMHVTADAKVSHQSDEMLIKTETSVTPEGVGAI